MSSASSSSSDATPRKSRSTIGWLYQSLTGSGSSSSSKKSTSTTTSQQHFNQPANNGNGHSNVTPSTKPSSSTPAGSPHYYFRSSGQQSETIVSDEELFQQQTADEEYAAPIDARRQARSTENTNNNSSSDPPPRDLKLSRYERYLQADNCDLNSLRQSSWNGIHTNARADVWRILAGYAPTNKARRGTALERRRADYTMYLKEYYHTPQHNKSTAEQELLHQIKLDVPRTAPHSKYIQSPRIQLSLERLLYVWSIRHPASGYVQGINDLAIPFYTVYTGQIIQQKQSQQTTTYQQPSQHANGAARHPQRSSPISTAITTEQLVLLVDNYDSTQLTDTEVQHIEADTFWCLSHLIDAIQDHYTFAQPGIQRSIYRMQELIQRVDEPLYEHFTSNGLQFIQFAFRWMNCLLTRELSMPLIIRLWDTYLSEGNGQCVGFRFFHIYVCVALLMTWASELKKLEFAELIMFLQKLPTDTWDERNVETLLSQAFVYQSAFDNAPKHLT